MKLTLLDGTVVERSTKSPLCGIGVVKVEMDYIDFVTLFGRHGREDHPGLVAFLEKLYARMLPPCAAMEADDETTS